jgi:hypothetical protein
MFATNSIEIFQSQIILCALILKVITSICNETIFHLIEKRFLTNLKTKQSAPKRPTTDTDNETEPKKKSIDVRKFLPEGKRIIQK